MQEKKKKMAGGSATAGGAASSGSSAGSAKGKILSSKLTLGKLKQLGDLCYSCTAKAKADLYLRTTEAIANYVGVEYGKNMRMLVKYGTEKTFTEPRAPRSDENTPGLMEKYKTELTIYHKDVKEYEDQKAKVFVVILEQCSSVVKGRLENDSGFATLESNDDVVGLLKKLKDMAFSTGGVQHPFWTLQTVLRHLTAINQGPRESVNNYHLRFDATVKVIEEQWGQFSPPKLAAIAGATATVAEKKAARDKLLTMIFLAGADKKRFGKFVDEWNNSYLGGIDTYPTSIDSAVTQLSHLLGHQKGVVKVDDGGIDPEVSFAQTKRKARIRCFKCNGLGHMKKDCPENRQSHMQSDDDSDDDDGSLGSLGSGGGWQGGGRR